MGSNFGAIRQKLEIFILRIFDFSISGKALYEFLSILAGSLSSGRGKNIHLPLWNPRSGPFLGDLWPVRVIETAEFSPIKAVTNLFTAARVEFGARPRLHVISCYILVCVKSQFLKCPKRL